MSETYLNVEEMVPLVEDIKLIVNSAREADANRLTRKGIFKGGLINPPQPFLKLSSNTISMPAFKGFTSKGDYIECNNEVSGFIISDSTISNDDNIISSTAIDLSFSPKWEVFDITPTNIQVQEGVSNSYFYSFSYNKKMILEGFKVTPSIPLNIEFYNYTNSISYGVFNLAAGETAILNLKAAINTDELRIKIISSLDLLNTGFNVSFSIEASPDANNTGSGASRLYIASSLNNSWVKSPFNNTYFYLVVARYKPKETDYRSSGFIPETSTPFYAYEEGSFEIRVLRRSGVILDNLTTNDILLGVVGVKWIDDTTPPVISVLSSENEFFNDSPSLDLFKLNVDSTKNNSAQLLTEISKLKSSYSQLQTLVNSLDITKQIIISQDFTGCIFPYAGQLSSKEVNLPRKVSDNNYVNGSTTIYYVGNMVLADGICLPEDIFPTLGLKLGTSMGAFNNYVVTPDYRGVFLRGVVTGDSLINDKLTECSQLPIQGGNLWYESYLSSIWGCVKSTPGRGYLGSAKTDYDNYAQQIDSTKQTRVVDGQTVLDTRYDGTEVAPNHKKVYFLIETGVNIQNWLDSI